MNERIQELIEECTDRHFPEGDNMFETFDKQRFAELIVRECAEVAKWTPSQFPNDEYVKNIKKHFGVE